jgi:hypothetical protein
VRTEPAGAAPESAERRGRPRDVPAHVALSEALARRSPWWNQAVHWTPPSAAATCRCGVTLRAMTAGTLALMREAHLRMCNGTRR